MTANLWQERAPHGSWFVRKADGTQVCFGSDKSDAEEFCAALNSHDASIAALGAIRLRATPHIDDDLKELQRQMHHIAALADAAIAKSTPEQTK